MKKLRRLVPAFLMLLLSVTLLTTSTFAWFSMNKTVSATNMQVVVTTDNTYLLINTDTNDTAAEIQSEGVTTIPLTVSASDAEVFPSSPALTDDEVAYLTVATGHNKVGGGAIETAGVKVTTPATASVVTNWFTANALAPDEPDIDVSTAQQLVSFDDYVIRKTAYLTVALGSNPANNLSVTPTITQKTGGTDVSAVKIIITTDDGGFAIITSTDSGNEIDIKGTNTDITDTTVRTVNIYIYYDGDEAPVYTNNKANLTGADISLQFDVDSHPAA